MITQNLIFLFVLFTTSFTFSQETESTSKFYLGISTSGDFAFRTLSVAEGNNDLILPQLIESRNTREQALFGYRVSGRLGYHLSKHIGLETGLGFSRSGYSTKRQDLFFVAPSSQIDPALPSGWQLKDNFYYVSVPLMANFSFGKNRLKFVTGLGTSFDFLVLSQSTSIKHYEGSKKKRNAVNSTKDFKTFNLSPGVSLGVSYNLKENLSLRLETAFRYGVVEIIDAPITANLWSTGLNCGLYFGL